MLFFDALICSEDRHFANFGLMVDSRTYRPYALFDHGLSLFYFGVHDDFGNPDDCAKTRSSAYSVPFDNIVKEFSTARQREKLRRMLDFTLPRDKTCHLPAWRGKAIEARLRKHAGKLIEISLQS